MQTVIYTNLTKRLVKCQYLVNDAHFYDASSQRAKLITFESRFESPLERFVTILTFRL